MNVTGRPIKSVCVAGAGIVGLSAALAFSRALPGVRVSLIATPADPAALADRLPVGLPSIHRFHAAIGFDELELVRAGIATHLIGTRFEQWSASGAPWIHVFGAYGIPAGEAPFHSVWQMVRGTGEALPFDRYAPAAALAREGKFVHPSDDPNSPLSTFLYGLRLDPARYREALAAASARLPRTAGAIDEVERRADGGIEAIMVAGQRIEADLFIDCTGPAAQLMSKVSADFEDWSAWLPCDRLVLAEQPIAEPSSCDRVTAGASGWTAFAPHADRALLTHAFFDGDQPAPAGETIGIRCGQRPMPWVRNVVAIGDGAVAIDPLHSANLHLAQSAILRALDLLPSRDCLPIELGEYNRLTGLETTGVRDFLAVHYLRSGRQDSAWAALSERSPPPTLARLLSQFERRGRIPFAEEETFDKHSWIAVLIGLGIMPRDLDAIAAGVDPGRARAGMDALGTRLDGLAGRFPPYREVIARMKAMPARPRR